jgi:dGTPase
MDFSDDVAYGVADIEDTVATTNHTLLDIEKYKNDIIGVGLKYFADSNTTAADLNGAIQRLVNLPFWIKKFEKTNKDFAVLKNLTSELIERFVVRIKIEDNMLIVPISTRNEIAILKSFAHIFFVDTPEQVKLKASQKQIIEKVYKNFTSKPSMMQSDFYNEYKNANSKTLKKRIIIDQISSLTDESIVKYV